MTGETDLHGLLQNLQPERAAALDPVCLFQEREGVPVILPKQQAEERGMSCTFVCAWIPLTVPSSLEAVGLTAAVSKALAEENISCNVVAAYSHDHLFISIADADRAWYPIGEIQAIRQMLGHTNLPEYVGDIEIEAPYRPEQSSVQIP